MEQSENHKKRPNPAFLYGYFVYFGMVLANTVIEICWPHNNFASAVFLTMPAILLYVIFLICSVVFGITRSRLSHKKAWFPLIICLTTMAAYIVMPLSAWADTANYHIYIAKRSEVVGMLERG